MSKQKSIDKQKDWNKAKVISAGVDIGTVSSKAAILLDGKPYALSQVRTRMPKESALSVLNEVLAETGLKLDKIHSIVATGIGRMQVPFAQETVSEIVCAAAGALYIWGPSVRTVLDIGGQSCKVIHCTEKGKVIDFLWSDKCAAGIGRSMESFADLLNVGIADIGNIALQEKQFPKLSDFCSVYAQSEALDLMQDNVPVTQIIAAYHHAMAKRVSTLTARSGVKEDFAVIGGLARNPGIIDGLETILKIKRLAPKPDWDPASTVALGAAVFADSSYRSK